MKYIGILLLSLLLVGCSSANKVEKYGRLNENSCEYPSTPNYVLSLVPPEDRGYIEPLTYLGTQNMAREKIISILGEQKNTTLVEKKDNYLHFEVRSSFFKFIDDVEFYFLFEKNLIHVRSMARSGYTDFGVNRKRMEEIRRKFNE